ncbi:MAG: DNA-directed RNA polymerase subunit alpha [Candidatus Coatesbacteria bacterium]|nr:DNA-directed RNA polymerase subunit alpha [Candidatus Coatesbacteria bacterium]
MHWKGISKPKGFVTEEATQFYGRFTAEPFERGFGVTVGNSLRRVLLSSLKGWSVTAVRIQGVQHQFSPVPGVVEDATEIILNLKKLRTRLSVFHAKVVYLNAKGPRKVTAADIKADPDVEILNPETYIAEVGEKSELKLEIRIEYGRGYVPADQHNLSDLPEGWIPVDSIFSPVRKVNFRVENVLHLERADYDRLLLEIWTDGSIGPLDATAHASKILKDIFVGFISFEEPEEEEEEEAAEQKVEINAGLKKSIEELDLGSRPLNCLRVAKIKYAAQLVSKTDQELLKLENFGKESLREVKKVLAEMDLELGQDLSDVEELAPYLYPDDDLEEESEAARGAEAKKPEPRTRTTPPKLEEEELEREEPEEEQEEVVPPVKTKPPKAPRKKTARVDAGKKEDEDEEALLEEAEPAEEAMPGIRKRADESPKSPRTHPQSKEEKGVRKKAARKAEKKRAKPPRRRPAETDDDEETSEFGEDI